MYECLFCGLINSSETAKFCSECGPDSPCKDWTPQNIDQESKVSKYASILSEFYFDPHHELDVEKYSQKIREKLKISHRTHFEILTKLKAQKDTFAHLFSFRLEFNENVIDAFAGHDTFLDFRYTNLSADDSFKISLVWDDPETTDRVDFRAETKGYVKPLGSVTIGSKAIFERIGIKEISELQLTISDQFGESAMFRVEPFRFKVANHDQNISTNITTNQHISIEGRGVVDASGVAGNLEKHSLTNNYQPIWRVLEFFYIPLNENFAIQESNESEPIHELSKHEINPSEEDFEADDNYYITSNSKNIKDAGSSNTIAHRDKVSKNVRSPTTLSSSSPIDKNLSATKSEIAVLVPDIGDFNEVSVIEILVMVGDTIKVEQSLITVESDKASMEIPSSHSGVVKDIKVKLGDLAKEGTPIIALEIEEDNENTAGNLPRVINSRIEVKAPSFSIDDPVAVVLSWKKKVGDYVTLDDVLVELETDKVSLEVSAPATGLLHQIFSFTGSTIRGEERLAIISTSHLPNKSEESGQLLTNLLNLRKFW